MSDTQIGSAAPAALGWAVRAIDCARRTLKIRSAVERIPEVIDVVENRAGELMTSRL